MPGRFVALLLACAPWAMAPAAAAQDRPSTPPTSGQDGQPDPRTDSGDPQPEPEPDTEPVDVQLDRARELFFEGIEHADRLEWRLAADRFLEALEIRQTPQVAYNLASALSELDQLMAAVEVLDGIAEDEEAPREVKQRAVALKQQVRRRAGRLTIEFEDREEHDEFLLDGRTVPAEDLGRALLVGPGFHLISVRRGEHEILSRSVELGRGESTVLVLGIIASPTVAAHQAAAQDLRVGSTHRQHNPLASDWRFWTGVAGVAVALATVAIVVAKTGGNGGGSADPILGDFDPEVLRW